MCCHWARARAFRDLTEGRNDENKVMGRGPLDAAPEAGTGSAPLGFTPHSLGRWGECLGSFGGGPWLRVSLEITGFGELGAKCGPCPAGEGRGHLLESTQQDTPSGTSLRVPGEESTSETPVPVQHPLAPGHRFRHAVPRAWQCSGRQAPGGGLGRHRRGRGTRPAHDPSDVPHFPPEHLLQAAFRIPWARSNPSPTPAILQEGSPVVCPLPQPLSLQ